ncbi:MAG: hypothetical protein LBB91_06450, partial [Clostridiales bacterium]|nr:hypothetical protein [Clostridiales bacterium]
MALTKEDLQAIRELVREEVTAETSPIKANITEQESKVTAETSSIKANIAELESKVTAETSSIKANIAK